MEFLEALILIGFWIGGMELWSVAIIGVILYVIINPLLYTVFGVAMLCVSAIMNKKRSDNTETDDDKLNQYKLKQYKLNQYKLNQRRKFKRHKH